MASKTLHNLAPIHIIFLPSMWSLFVPPTSHHYLAHMVSTQFCQQAPPRYHLAENSPPSQWHSTLPLSFDFQMHLISQKVRAESSLTFLWCVQWFFFSYFLKHWHTSHDHFYMKSYVGTYYSKNHTGLESLWSKAGNGAWGNPTHSSLQNIFGKYLIQSNLFIV